MRPENIIALLGVAVALLSIAVPVILRRTDRALAKVERLEASNQVLRETNVDLKIQLMGLQRVGQVVDRTFSGLPPVGSVGEDGKP
jgi:hypothetical protein